MKKKEKIIYFFWTVLITLLLFPLVLSSGASGQIDVVTPKSILSIAEVSEGQPNTANEDPYSFYVAENDIGQGYRTYLKFNLSDTSPYALSYEEVLISLGAESSYSETNNVSIHYVSYSDWDESNTTWNNQPCGVGFDNSTYCNLTAQDKSNSFTSGSFTVLNLTSVFNEFSGDTISFVLKMEDEDYSSGGQTAVFIPGMDSAFGDMYPQLNITYTPYIKINSPSSSEIFTEDAPTTLFNITNNSAMHTCYAELDNSANFSLSYTGPYWDLTNTSMIDGSHTVDFWCNETSGGAWRNSEQVSFDVDSINLSVCRNLTVSDRTYEIIQNITENVSAYCLYVKNNDTSIDGKGNYINFNSSSCTLGPFETQNECGAIVSDWVYMTGWNKIYNLSIDNLTINNLNPSSSENVYGLRLGNIFNLNISNVHILMGGNTNIKIPISTGGGGFEGVYNSRFINLIFDNLGDSSSIINSNVSIIDSNFSSGVSIEGGNVNLTNVTFESSSFSGSRNINRFWYFDLYVNKTNGDPFTSAVVEIYDFLGGLFDSPTTNSSGYIERQTLLEYVNNASGYFYNTPHTINVTKTDYVTNSTTYNLTELQNVNSFTTLSLSNVIPTSTISSPVNYTNSSSLTNTIVCNSSDSDGDLSNVTLYTWIGGSLESQLTKNITGSSNSSEFTNYGFVSQATYLFNCKVCDTNGACDWDVNRTLYIDTTNPSATAYSPSSGANVSSTTQNLIANLTDNRGIKGVTLRVWNNAGTLINTTHKTYASGTTSIDEDITYIFGQGTYTWTYNVSDQSGNIASTGNQTIFVDSIAPSLTITYPSDGSSTQDNESLSINYTVSESGIGLDSCWWTNNSGIDNNSISCSTNLTQDYVDGTYTFTFYANDSVGNLGSDEVTFTVSTQSPSINIITPTDNQYLNSDENINFTFIATDSDGVDTCELWSDWTGSWSLNETFAGIISGTQNYTLKNISANGAYTWAVWCNDTVGNSAFTGTNYTFTLDVTNPSLLDNGFSPSTVYNNLNVYIQANASDTYLEDVWIEINRSGSYENLTVTNVSGDVYTYILYSMDISNQENISWRWWANDTATNTNVTLLNNFVVTNRIPQNVTIESPLNDTYRNVDWINISFSAVDEDGLDDTLNYTLYNSTDGVTFTIFNSTTDSWLNFSGFNATDESAIYYYYMNVSDGYSSNISEIRQFGIDLTNPTAPVISLPTASPTPQCSIVNVALNYTYNETNVDYCTVHMTTGGVDSFPATNISGCLNGTIYSTYDNSVQILNITIYDKAGNSNNTEKLVYFDTDNAICSSPVTPGGGGGTTVIIGGTNETRWTMSTVPSGTGVYEITIYPGLEKSKQVVFKNLGTTSREIDLRCENTIGDLCRYVTFDKDSFTLGISEIDTFRTITTNIPENVLVGDYSFAIIAEDQESQTGKITFNIQLKNSLFAKTANEKSIAGINFPIWLLVIFGTLIIGAISSYGIDKKKYKNKEIFTLVISLLSGAILLIIL